MSARDGGDGDQPVPSRSAAALRWCFGLLGLGILGLAFGRGLVDLIQYREWLSGQSATGLYDVVVGVSAISLLTGAVLLLVLLLTRVVRWVVSFGRLAFGTLARGARILARALAFAWPRSARVLGVGRRALSAALTRAGEWLSRVAFRVALWTVVLAGAGILWIGRGVRLIRQAGRSLRAVAGETYSVIERFAARVAGGCTRVCIAAKRVVSPVAMGAFLTAVTICAYPLRGLARLVGRLIPTGSACVRFVGRCAGAAQDFLRRCAEVVGAGAMAALRWLGHPASRVVAGVVALARALARVVGTVCQAVASIARSVGGAFPAGGLRVRRLAWAALLSSGHAVSDVLSLIGRAAWYVVSSAGRTAWRALSFLGRWVWTAITFAARAAWMVLSFVGRWAWRVLSYAGRAVWAFLSFAGRTAWTILSFVGRGAWVTLSFIGRRAWAILSFVGRRAWDIFALVGRKAWDIFAFVGHKAWTALSFVSRGAWAIIAFVGRWVWTILSFAVRAAWTILSFVGRGAWVALSFVGHAAWSAVCVLGRGMSGGWSFLGDRLTVAYYVCRRAARAIVLRARPVMRMAFRRLGQLALLVTSSPVLLVIAAARIVWAAFKRIRRAFTQAWPPVARVSRRGLRLALRRVRETATQISWSLVDLRAYTLPRLVYWWRIAAWRIRRARATLGGVGRLCLRFASSQVALARRVAYAGVVIGAVGVLGIAPAQRALGAVDCGDAQALLGLGAGLSSASAAGPSYSVASTVSQISWLVWETVSGESRRTLCVPPDALIVGYSPDKAAVFRQLVADFNASRSPDLPPMRAFPLDSADMLESALDGKLNALSPDSGVWLAELDVAWRQRNPASSALIGSTVRYASSPLVVAMWESGARNLGTPTASIDWASLAQLATDNPGFQWSHPAATTSTGLLTTAAVYYAGAGKLTDLSLADLESPATAEYVKQVEATVGRYGGESDDRFVSQLLTGSRRLDAFVVQEQVVVKFNLQEPRSKLVAVYPPSGTFVMDHPLALLEGATLTDPQRRAFERFAEFVRQPEQQRLLLREGYRPASEEAALDDPESPITPEQRVDPSQPRVLLGTPSPEILSRIRGSWQSTKRPANIYLVVDVSGSMGGDKLAAAQLALSSFIDQIQSDREQVGLVAFSGSVRELEALGPLADGRAALKASVAQLTPGGETALYDAVLFATDKLQKRRDTDRINAIVVMTDGQDTASQASLEQVVKAVQSSDPAVLVFAVAYGDDADPRVLSQIADAVGGQAYTSYPATVRRLYELIAQFF
jgi:Ca-activated chloride channel homolog